MLSNATRTGATCVVLAVAWALAGGCGSDSDAGKASSSSADGAIAKVLSEVVPDDGGDAPVVVKISTRSLKASEQVVPGIGASSHMATGKYWFALVDYSFSALWGKSVRYAFLDEGTGQVSIEDQGWWPQISGQSLPDAGVGLTSIFAPRLPTALSPAQPASGGGSSTGAPPHVLLAVTADHDTNTVSARLMVDGSLGGGYLNFAADYDGDGKFASSGAGDEWVVRNASTGRSGGRWTFTEPFALPVGPDNKFPGQFWTRVRLSSTALPANASWDGACDGATCKDQLTIIDALDAPSQPANQPALGPRSLPKVLIDTSKIPAASCKATCKTQGLTFDVPCKALVINFGDSPGRTETVIGTDADNAEGLFKKRFGDDNVQRVDGANKTAIKAAIKAFVSAAQCMQQSHIYFAGHGASKAMLNGEHESAIWLKNSDDGMGNVMTAAEIRDAVTAAGHCPDPMNYYANKCGGAGYCNLSLYMMNCYSGGFLQGETSLEMPGLNVLTLTSADIKGTGRQGIGTAVGLAFADAFRDNQADADKDGETTTSEAMTWAREHYEGHGKVDDRPAAGMPMKAMYDTDPQQTNGADCNCVCVKPGGCFDEPGSEAAKAIELLLSMNEPTCQHDLISNITHSSAAVAAKSVAHDHSTITQHASAKPTWDAVHVTKLYGNTDFPCGSGPNGTTLCPQPLQTVPAGDFIVLFTLVEKPIPLADPTNLYQYAFVFDADGVAANNYQPSAAYPNDFFKGSDRWYEVSYKPGAGWSAKVSRIVNNVPQTEVSAARITINGNVIALVVPASEFSAPKPSFRITAFRHTGDYGLNPPYNWDGSIWPNVATGLAAFP